jgi:four helix bundle protein
MKTQPSHSSDFSIHSSAASPPQDIKERTFEFASRVVRLCRALEESPGVSRTLANQLLRSGTSVGANVEEAHGSHSKPDFIAKMSIANKEARETNYWLRLLAASDVVPSDKLTDITDESNQLIAILTTIVKRSRENRDEK